MPLRIIMIIGAYPDDCEPFVTKVLGRQLGLS